MADGDIAGAVVPVRSDDEVGVLARSFNQMASDLERSQRDLVEAEKFAFVGELAAGVAHEVRTSLGVLRSAAQMLGRSLASAPGSEIPELVGMIRDEVGRLGAVVDDLLKLDRPRGMLPEPTSLSLPLVRAAEFVEPQASEKGVLIAVSCPATAPIVACDREALQHACVNLLVNAVQYLPRGGRVELVVEGARAGFGCFRVSDDGPGIPEDVRQRIFDPFMTGREAGVGLGLTFVKRAIHEHGGRITVAPSDAGGACFRVEIPLAKEQP
jgi:signal transduction histidine kinase